MKVADVGPFDELFTHIDEVDGHQTTYAVTPMRAHIETVGYERFKIPVEEGHALYCLENRGVEEARLLSLVQTEAGRQAALRPIIFIELPDGAGSSHLLVDGTHRYVLFHKMQVTSILAYIISASDAKPFIVEDMEQVTKDELMQESQLATLRHIFGHQS